MKSFTTSGRRLGAVGCLAGVGLTLALVIPSAANAASVVSQGNGQLITTSLFTTDMLNSVASLNGAQAVNTDGSSSVSTDLPVDPTALSALSLPINGVNLFGNNGIIQLGAVGQYAQANGDGSSVAFSGAVSQASSLAGIGTTPTPSNIGSPAPGSNAEISLGNPASDPASIDAQWGLLAASAQETADGKQTGSYTLEAKQITVGGTVVTSALSPISSALNTVLGVASGLGVNVANPISGGTVTITMDDLLAVAGVSSINDLPPNTDLVQYVPQAVANKVTSLVNGTLSTLSGDVGSIPLLGGTLQTAINTATSTINPLLNNLGSTLVTPLGSALSSLVQLDVNNQAVESNGSFTETALKVGLGSDGSLGTVDLANATVGPNGGLAAVPVINAASGGIAGGALAVGLGVAGAAVLMRRRRAVVAVQHS